MASFREARFVPVLSSGLLEEVRDVCARARIRGRFRIEQADVDRFLVLLEDRAVLVEPVSVPAVARDSDDDLVLATALQGGAGCLVSGDDDLMKDGNVIAYLARHGVALYSVSQFLELLASA
jgi:putative PIN family toxin of toxin-antitoxin system